MKATVHKKETSYITQCDRVIMNLTQSETSTSYDDPSRWDDDHYTLCNDCWEEYTKITKFTNANT